MYFFVVDSLLHPVFKISLNRSDLSEMSSHERNVSLQSFTNVAPEKCWSRTFPNFIEVGLLKELEKELKICRISAIKKINHKFCFE